MRVLNDDGLRAKGIDYSRPQLWRLEKAKKFPKRIRLGLSPGSNPKLISIFSTGSPSATLPPSARTPNRRTRRNGLRSRAGPKLSSSSKYRRSHFERKPAGQARGFAPCLNPPSFSNA